MVSRSAWTEKVDGLTTSLLNGLGKASNVEKSLSAYESITEARDGLKTYFDFYNYEHRHQGLDGRTPNEVYSGTIPKQMSAA
jgi:pentatricopeptide repeat protein